MNRKVVALVLGVLLCFLALSLGGAVYVYHLRTSRVVIARPEVNVTGSQKSFEPLTVEQVETKRKEFDKMFVDDADPKVQALPASAVKRP